MLSPDICMIFIFDVVSFNIISKSGNLSTDFLPLKSMSVVLSVLAIMPFVIKHFELPSAGWKHLTG